MKVSTEKIPDAQVVMTIEVEKERVDEARGRALKKLAPRAKIPGFRPGKAPAPMVERYFGPERILDEALDLLVPDVYKEAVLADESIDPIARPRLEVETVDPLVVKATIPVRPVIELGDYTSVRVAMEAPVVGEERVEETLLALRRRAATHEPVERGLGWRDIVRMDVRGVVEVEDAPSGLVDAGGNPIGKAQKDEPLVEQKDVELQLIEERDVLFPGFEEALLGHAKGEIVAFELAVPAGVRDERFAGKPCRFTVTIHETKEEVLPDADEAFAKQAGEYESIDELRQSIRDSITRGEQEALNAGYHDKILGQIIEQSAIEFPPVLLATEIDHLLHEQAGHIERGQGMEAYLAAIGKTEEQMHEELRPIADLRLRRSLVLSKVAEAEDIQVSDADIDAEVETLSATGGPQAAQLRQLFGGEQGRATIRRNLLMRRTLARLIDIAGQDGTAPSMSEKKPARAKKAAGRSKKQEAQAAPEAGAAEDSGGA